MYSRVEACRATEQPHGPAPAVGVRDAFYLAVLYRQSERDEKVYVVRCRQAERFAPTINFSNWRARLQFHAELERLGVITALEKAGAGAGDTVRIANKELEWD